MKVVDVSHGEDLHVPCYFFMHAESQIFVLDNFILGSLQ
jgi:hypothetical protein